MSYLNNLPFEKGNTQYEAALGGSVPTSGADYTKCGHEYVYTDPTSHRLVTLRAVRNESGITLYGKQPVQLNASGTSITGYARDLSEQFVVLDDDLGSGGVVDDDVCYVVVRGPCTVKTAGTINAIAAGNRLTAGTSANSTAAGTTAAGVALLGAIASVTAAATINNGVAARAISAATTNQTQTDIRVCMDANLV